MGDKTWHFIDCPKCGGKETVECFEHDSGWLKVDSCSECDYVKNYEYEEKDGVIHITEVSDLVATDNQSQDEPLKSATPDIDTQIESLLINATIEFMEKNVGQVITPKSDPQIKAWAEHIAKAIKTLLDTAVQEARIDELKKFEARALWDDHDIHDAKDWFTHIQDRIKELKSTSKEKE